MAMALVVNIGGDPILEKSKTELLFFFFLFHDCKDFEKQFNIKTRIKYSK